MKERARLMRRLGDLIDQNVPDIAAMETADTGLPIHQTKNVLIPRASHNFEFFAEACQQMNGKTYPDLVVDRVGFAVHLLAHLGEEFEVVRGARNEHVFGLVDRQAGVGQRGVSEMGQPADEGARAPDASPGGSD